MFIRKYWLPISVFIVAIMGIGLYLLATQPPKEPIKIYKVVQPEKPTEQPKAEAPVGDTLQGGHVHADGTWHEGSHETEGQPTPEVPVEVELAKDPEYGEYPYGPPDSPLSPEERVEQAWNNREFGELDGHAVPLTPMPVLYRHYFNSDEEHYRATKRWHELGVAQNKLIHEIFDRQNAKLEKTMGGGN